MKKLFLLALTLGVSVFGMAQAPVKVSEISEEFTQEPNSLADPDNPVYYIIKGTGQQSSYTSPEVWLYDNGDAPKGGATSPDQLSDAGTYVWQIVPVEGKEGIYTFKNYSSTNYLNVAGTESGGEVSMSASEVEVELTIGGEGQEDWVGLKNPDADQWIDMGWSGTGTITTWGGGLPSSGSSRHFQIFEVTLEEGDPHEGAVDNLTTVIDNTSGDLDTWAENIGTDRWQYQEELYNAFSASLENANAMLEDPDSYTTEQLNAAAADLQKTHDTCANNVNPASQQEYADGYYMIVSGLTFTGSVEKQYTAEEAEAANEENAIADSLGVNPGEEGWIPTYNEGFPVKEGDTYTTTAEVTKAMYDNSGTASWMTYAKKAEFLFKLEHATPAYVAKNTDATKVYKVTNMMNQRTFGKISTSSAVPMSVCDSLFTFDIIPGETRTEAEYPLVDIRNAGVAGEQYYYLHCGGHGGGSGVSGNIVGWCDDGSTKASQWYLQPISDEEAEEWMSSDQAKANKMIAEVTPYTTTIPAQITIAKDETTTVDMTKPLITDATQFSSPYTTLDEQALTEEQIFQNLISDEETTSYWHSAWESGSVSQDVHYLQVALTDDEVLDGSYTVRLSRRPVSGDQITKLDVRGYSDNDESLSFNDGINLGSVVLPMGTTNNETLNGTTLFSATADQNIRFIRFYSAEEVAFSSGGGSNRGYWHCRKFQIYPAEVGYYYGDESKTQYSQRKDLADAATAAIEAWNEGEWNADSIAAGKQTIADLTASYNALKLAAENWTAVYVDPTDLRAAMATVKPNVEMIVTGNNPGEWKEGIDVFQIMTAYNSALAYDQAGQYTPAQSTAYIENLSGTVSNVLAQANKIEAGKWYRIHFPKQEIYVSAGWDQTGAKSAFAKYDDQQEEEAGKGAQDVLVSKALFGQYLAPGKNDYEYSDAVIRHNEEGESYEDSVVMYRPFVSTEAVAGHNIVFTDDTEKAGLFRFITATDSTYYIQNKETGLYLANNSNDKVVLSASPYTYNTQAIGWGTSLINAFTIDGKKVAPLHGERATNLLVTWNATTLGSNSMMCIESTEESGEPASADFTMEMWPGQLYAYTFAGDVTLDNTDNLDIYSAAGFAIDDENKTNMITLDKTKFSGKVLKAGVPYIIRTKLAEGAEYISLGDAQQAAETAAQEEAGEEINRAQMKEADEKAWNDNVVTIAATHATSFVDEVSEPSVGCLYGTFSAKSAETANTFATVTENSFQKASSCGIMSAYVDIKSLNKVYSLKWQEGTVGVYGDVNGDGVVDAADITAVITSMYGEYSKAADVNNNGVVDAADITAVITAMYAE